MQAGALSYLPPCFPLPRTLPACGLDTQQTNDLGNGDYEIYLAGVVSIRNDVDKARDRASKCKVLLLFINIISINLVTLSSL